jgi:PTS system nitrogen regulatory IIA component
LTGDLFRVQMSTVVHDQGSESRILRGGMELNVRAAASLLRVSTKTIYRWVGSGRIPGYRVNNTFRFDRSELLEWATANRMRLDAALLNEPVGPVPSFDEALENGGIHYRIGGRDRDAVLRNVVQVIRIDIESERDQVFDALRAREELASTSIGDGLALPHLRNPLRFHFERPSVAVCFLEGPVDWNAPDGEPVEALLVVVAATVRAVLQLHHRAYFALRVRAFRSAVLEELSRDAILAAARAATATLRPAPETLPTPR